MRIEVSGRPDIVVPLGTSEDVAAASSLKIVVKEGEEYKLKIVFTVYAETGVLGLKFTNVVSKLGVRVDKQVQMLGSYPPAATP